MKSKQWLWGYSYSDDVDDVFEENSEKSESDILLPIKTELSDSVKVEPSDPELEISEWNLKNNESYDQQNLKRTLMKMMIW